MTHAAGRNSPTRGARRLAFGALAFAAALAASAPPSAPAAADPLQARPNVLIIMTDDHSVSQFNRRFMPKTFRWLAGDEGTRFTRSYVSSPLCCPSRAGLLTGQYPHNNNVYDNTPGYSALNEKDSTIFTWLQAAGYRTGLIGRFLLGYNEFATRPADPYAPALPAAPAPPGVDDFYGFAQAQAVYFDVPFSNNGVPTRTAPDRRGYATRVINERAASFIRNSAPSEQPFFLWVAHIAPHKTALQPRGSCGNNTAINEPGTFAPFRDEPLPEPPSFNEQRNRDKPAWIQSRPPLHKRQKRALTRAWRCSAATLASVDRGVANLVRTLRQSGELDETAIFFTSDNGLHFGEHRVMLEKIYPYEEAWRVPLLARVPPAYLGGADPPRHVTVNVSNLDLTATALDLAEAPACNAAGVCRILDGRSLARPLGGTGLPFPPDRAVLAQIGNRACGSVPSPGQGIRNFYDAIRTTGYMYAEHNRVHPATGACDRPERELYDLDRDPYELRNRAVNPALRSPSAIQAELAQRLQALVRCAGVAGRDPQSAAEDGSPLPFCE